MKGEDIMPDSYRQAHSGALIFRPTVVEQQHIDGMKAVRKDREELSKEIESVRAIKQELLKELEELKKAKDKSE